VQGFAPRTRRAILVGGNTAFVDNPVTDRRKAAGETRVVLDNRLRVSTDSTLAPRLLELRRRLINCSASDAMGIAGGNWALRVVARRSEVVHV